MDQFLPQILHRPILGDLQTFLDLLQCELRPSVFVDRCEFSRLCVDYAESRIFIQEFLLVCGRIRDQSSFQNLPDPREMATDAAGGVDRNRKHAVQRTNG